MSRTSLALIDIIGALTFQLVVRNSIDTIDTVSILGIVTGIVTKTGKKNKYKNKNNRETGQMLKKPKKFEVRKLKYVTNLWV